MSQCRANPACPFPAVEGYRECAQHRVDLQLTETLHEMSGDRDLSYQRDWLTDGGEGHAGGFSIVKGGSWHARLRANTYHGERRILNMRKAGRPRKMTTPENPELTKRIEEMKSKQAAEASKYPSPITPPIRYRLPEERQSIIHKFTVDGVRCYLTVGLYPDGRPGEVFLLCNKKGSFERGMVDGWSILFSMLLQNGVPLGQLVDKFKHVKFPPAGVTDNGNRELRFADSILDYVVRWMRMKFEEGTDGK